MIKVVSVAFYGDFSQYQHIKNRNVNQNVSAIVIENLVWHHK
jgi:hypothetical protein